jgi:hypothetical protein
LQTQFTPAGPNLQLTVNLVEKDDTGLRRPRFLKQHPELPFRLAHPFRKHIGTFAHEEGCGVSGLSQY